jgi:hypothetical protein
MERKMNEVFNLKCTKQNKNGLDLHLWMGFTIMLKMVGGSEGAVGVGYGVGWILTCSRLSSSRRA